MIQSPGAAYLKHFNSWRSDQFTLRATAPLATHKLSQQMGAAEGRFASNLPPQWPFADVYTLRRVRCTWMPEKRTAEKIEMFGHSSDILPSIVGVNICCADRLHICNLALLSKRLI